MPIQEGNAASAAKLMFKLAQTIVETVEESGEAPSGIIFHAFNEAGVNINTYNTIISHLIEEKILKTSNHVLTINNRDRAVELGYLSDT
jgi:hypothetical protein